jgi:signal transduction histidine kinase
MRARTTSSQNSLRRSTTCSNDSKRPSTSQRRFVANASHELRTPLTLDRALLERALRKQDPTDVFWQTTCERLLASSQQQNHLIDALLTLARSEAALERNEPCDLDAVVDSVLQSPELKDRSTITRSLAAM